jgi:hypothetical protein
VASALGQTQRESEAVASTPPQLACVGILHAQRRIAIGPRHQQVINVAMHLVWPDSSCKCIIGNNTGVKEYQEVCWHAEVYLGAWIDLNEETCGARASRRVRAVCQPREGGRRCSLGRTAEG